MTKHIITYNNKSNYYNYMPEHTTCKD